jgi:hypothetical protein
MPQLMVKMPKDPTMAVETLKQLMSSELLSTAAANGYTELHGELEGLAKSIYLNVSDLVGEIINQESQTTMFSGNRLFDLLRSLASNAVAYNNEDAANAIANFLKAVNFSFNRDEILNALSANLRFLSTYFQPSPQLSEKLSSLAEAWSNLCSAGRGDAEPIPNQGFEQLKGETISLLRNVSESLLNNEKTQILIPLIIHNLSRYNTNDYMLKEAFAAMLTHVPHSHKGAFIAAFDDFLNAVLSNPKLPEAQQAQEVQQSQQAQQPQQAQESQQARETQQAQPQEKPVPTAKEGTFPHLYSQKLEQGDVFPPYNMTRDTLADGLRGFLLGKLEGMQAITMILTNLIEGAQDAPLLTAMQADLAKIDSITALVNYLNDILMQLPDVPERQMLFEMLSETVAGMAEKGEMPPDSPERNPEQNPASTPPDPRPASTEETKSPQTQQVQNPQTPEKPAAGENTSTGTLPELKNITPEQLVKLVQGGEGENLTGAEKSSAEKSSLEELTSFIEKNINHNALKTLDSYNASNLLQSLINAPGVYTPLSHFVIPLQIGDVRAFGELWIDNEAGGGGNAGGEPKDKIYHLFLTFEIEGVGRFETDLYAQGSQVSLAVLHPEGFLGEMKDLKEKINRIIASTDYSVKEFQTAILCEPHDLTDIFPRIVEKRQGLDISI